MTRRLCDRLPAWLLLAGLTAGLAGTVAPAWADAVVPQSMQAVPAGLPALPANTAVPNPYRGNAAVLDAGATAYARHCAYCHGDGSVNAVAEGPDLRRLNSFCNRLKDAALKQHCLRDVDSYYLQSVREGKVRAGVVHMPAWAALLPQETIWAIRSFTETRALPGPRLLPDLPPVR